MNSKTITRTLQFLIVVFNISLFYSIGHALEAEDQSGIIYGTDHVFSLKAPAGWVLDNTSGLKDGLHAVFYPKGSTWESANTVFYAKAISKSKPGYSTLNEAIKSDQKDFQGKSPSITIKSGKMIPIASGKKVPTQQFLKDRFGNYETVAYIEEEKVIVLLACSSSNLKEYKKSSKAFEKLVRSYHFLDNVIVDDSKT